MGGYSWNFSDSGEWGIGWGWIKFSEFIR